jgi:hypothetical protein
MVEPLMRTPIAMTASNSRRALPDELASGPGVPERLGSSTSERRLTLEISDGSVLAA